RMSEKSSPARKINRRQSGQPTISDVARLANCSPMTVSRVINNEASVREQTRAVVLEAIETLNYKPNRAARSLAGAAQMRIALLYSNPSASYLSELLMGSLEQASRSDVHLVVERCEFDKDEEQVITRLVETGIDGFLLPSPLCDEAALLDLLAEQGSLGRAGRRDGRLWVERCEFDKDEEQSITRLVETGIDGFLLPSPLCDEAALLDRLAEQGSRAVLIGPGKAHPKHSAVMIDEYQ